MSNTLSVDELSECVSYDAEAGCLRWKMKVADKCVIGARIGSPTAAGYIQLQIRGKKLLAHRVAWSIATGALPVVCIDHINGNKADNRLCNLRLATSAENARNARRPRTNTSGIKGVSWCNLRNKWSAQIAIGGGKVKHLGRFHKKEGAAAAYRAASLAFHKDFSRLE